MVLARDAPVRHVRGIAYKGSIETTSRPPRPASAGPSRLRAGVDGRHVMDGLGITVADGGEDLTFRLVQLCASAIGKPLTDDELRLIAGYPHQVALLYPGLLG